MKTQTEGVRQIRRLLSAEKNPPVKPVLEAGVLPRLIELMQAEDTKLQFECAWALTNIASTDYTRVVVDSGAVPLLVAGMMSGDANVREQCMWCIGNIAGDCATFRDGLYATENAINNLLLNIQHPESLALLRNATWALSNFCRNAPAPSAEHAAMVLPAMSYLIAQDDKDVVTDAMWGLVYLTETDEAMIDTVLGYEGVLPQCVALLGHADLPIMMPAMRILGNVISGAEHHTQAAIDAGVLHALVPLIKTGRRNIRREACWAASNAAAGTAAQITALMTTPGLLDAVIGEMKEGEWNVRKEATWVICNIATAGNAEHVCRLASCAIIEPLVDVLKTMNDTRIMCVVMDALNAILGVEKRFKAEGNAAAAMCRFADQVESAGGVVRLEELQEMTDDMVYEKAKALVRNFFEIEAEEEAVAEVAAAPSENVAPMAPLAIVPKPFAGFGGGFGAPAAAAAAGSGAGKTPVKAAAAPVAAASAFGAAPAGGLNFANVAFV